MKHSFVGRLHNFDHLDSLNDNLILGGMNFLKARYLGDNMVLITSLDGTQLTNIIEENKNMSMEYSLVPQDVIYQSRVWSMSHLLSQRFDSTNKSKEYNV